MEMYGSIFFPLKVGPFLKRFILTHSSRQVGYSDEYFSYRIWPNYRTVRLGFSKLLGALICGKICIYLLRIHYKKDQKDLFDDDYAILIFFIKAYVVGTHLNWI